MLAKCIYCCCNFNKYMPLLACNLITLQSFLNLNHQLFRSTSIKPVFHFSRIIPKHSLFLCFLSNDFGYFKFLDLKKNWKLALKLHWKDLCCCSNFEKCSNLYAYQQHLKRKCYHGTLRYGWNGKQALRMAYILSGLRFWHS